MKEEDENSKIEYLFHQLFEALSDEIKKPIFEYWSKIEQMSGVVGKIPFIRTDLANGSTFGYTFGPYIEINLKLAIEKNESLVDTIYHEIGHCHHIAKNEILIFDAVRSESARAEAEIYADEFAKEAQARIQKESFNFLRRDERLAALSLRYNLSPLL